MREPGLLSSRTVTGERLAERLGASNFSKSLIARGAFVGDCEGTEVRVMRHISLSRQLAILMARVTSMLAASPAFAVTCTIDGNSRRHPLGRVDSWQGQNEVGS
jgi:hypothetical protein